MTDNPNTIPSASNTAWAPPPPPPAKKKIWGFVALGVAGVVALLVAGVVIVMAQSEDSAPAITTTTKAEREEVMVYYSITLNDALCSHEYDTYDGYSDITEGTEVEVFDGSGNLLGFGSLGECDLSTTYSATFPVRISGDGVYRITLGNDNRGYLNYTEDDIIGGNLYSQASLG
jgi:hypothetical protein